MADTAPDLDAKVPGEGLVLPDFRVALGLALFGLAVGAFVGFKIRGPRKPCNCEEVPPWQGAMSPSWQAAPAPPPAVFVPEMPGPRPAPPVMDIPGVGPSVNDGMLTFSPHNSTGPGPKLADPPAGFNGHATDPSETLRFA